MAERGSPAAGGLLLAALSAGSLIGGLVYGARTWPGSPPRQLVAADGGPLGAPTALLALAGVPLVLAALLAARRPAARAHHGGRLDAARPRRAAAAPPPRRSRSWSWGIVAGTAAGNALGGAIVDGPGFEAAVLSAGGVAAGGALIALRIR